QRDPSLTISSDEWNAIEYLRVNAPDRSVVLASPTSSLFVLALSSLRVLYGVPGETPHASQMLAQVVAFYSNTRPQSQEFLTPVDYIIDGPSERAMGIPSIPIVFKPVFTSGGVTVYERPR